MDKGIDIPGPVDWEHASHWIEFNLDTLMCETWCRVSSSHPFPIMTRMRPMVESEIISQKLLDHSRTSVLHAFGVEEDDLYDLIKRLRKENDQLTSQMINWSAIKNKITSFFKPHLF